MAVSDTLKQAAHAVGAHRVTTRPFTGPVRVERDGRILAASDRAIALDETGLPTRFYMPRDDVRMDLLASSEATSHCPFKGDATDFSAPGAKDAFWVYESPSEEAAMPVAGMLAPGLVASTSSSTAAGLTPDQDRTAPAGAPRPPPRRKQRRTAPFARSEKIATEPSQSERLGGSDDAAGDPIARGECVRDRRLRPGRIADRRGHRRHCEPSRCSGSTGGGGEKLDA